MTNLADRHDLSFLTQTNTNTKRLNLELQRVEFIAGNLTDELEYAMLKLAYKRRQIMTKILIIGIGITGKSAFRERLAKIFSDAGFDVKEFDADYDYEKIPTIFTGSATYIVEDVHATTNEAIAALDSYDFIFYIQTNMLTHILFWLSRMITWFKNGQYLWDQKNGWRGTGKKYDFRNIPPILKGFLRDFRNRKKWIDKDIKAILASKVPYVIIQSQWAPKHIKFCVHHSKN